MEILLVAVLLLSSPVIHLIASGTATLLHAAEELWGDGGPLWDNFGDIVHVRVDPVFGFLAFSVGLPLALAYWAYWAYLEGSVVAISLLFGARVGDTLISHWGLWALGWSDPNPGIWTTGLYVLEAILIAANFSLLPWYCLAGAGFFATVLPGLKLYGAIQQYRGLPSFSWRPKR